MTTKRLMITTMSMITTMVSIMIMTRMITQRTTMGTVNTAMRLTTRPVTAMRTWW